jgi:excisionase family DNA binding protein
MSATALQLQNTTAESFKSEIVQDIKEYFDGVLKTMATADNETYLTRQEVSNLLNVSLPTIWAWTNKGVLVSYRIGNKIRYRKSEIIAAMKQI